LWNNHCSLTDRQKSRQTENHTEGTPAYVHIRDAHLVDTAFYLLQGGVSGVGGRDRGRKGGLEDSTEG